MLEDPLKRLNKIREKVVAKTIQLEEIKPTQLPVLRDSCALAKVMERIEPTAFDNAMIYEYP